MEEAGMLHREELALAAARYGPLRRKYEAGESSRREAVVEVFTGFTHSL
jgi:hypothetical protein